MRKRIAIVHEPEASLQAAQSAALTEQGWQCEIVESVADLGLRKAGDPPLAIFLDLEAAGADWTRVVFELRGLYPEAALVLKGAKPGDIPWGPMEMFSLVVNQKAAAAQGVTLSPEFLKKADKIIK